MDENQNKMDLEKNIKERDEKLDEEEQPEFLLKEYYKDKQIGLFIESTLQNNINKIIEEINHYYEIGDWRNCIILMKKITSNKIFKIMKKEKKIEFLDIITKKLINNIYIYSKRDVNVLIEFLCFNLHYIPKGYVFDWKQFYTLFYITDSYDNINDSPLIVDFYSKIKEYIPEDAITIEDYQILRKSFLDGLIMDKLAFPVLVLIYFLPKKFLCEDDQLQLRLFYMLKNWKSNFQISCCLFIKILSDNGKLYFSKNPKENDEYIKQFIQYYFTYLNLFINGDSKVSSNIILAFNQQVKNDFKFDKIIVEILYCLLFNESLKEYSNFVEIHLKIILNKHLYLKERSRDATTKNYISFLQILILKMEHDFHKKVYDKDIEKKIKIIKPYKDEKYIYDRFLLILKYFSLNFEKLFLFDNERTCFCQKKLFIFLAEAELDEEYMKQILININFENYLKMLKFFKANGETRMAKFILKLYSILPLLLNEYIFTNYPNVRELIKESIQYLSENVSSANSSVDIDILITFGSQFFRVKELSKKNKIYGFLIPIITEGTIKIMTNLLRILDLICQRHYLDYYIFIKSMKKFLDKDSQKIISSMYMNYIQNYEIESSNMEYYLFVLNDEELIDLFNYIHNNLLFIHNSNDVEINKHFLYEKYDKDFNINISDISVEIFIEKQLQGFASIFSFMEFSKILKDEKMIKKFYEIFYALINQKDKKFRKLATEFFGLVLNSILEVRINENLEENTLPLIEYPSEKEINIVVQMYEKLILPYENFIKEYMEKNSNNKNNNKQIDKQSLEEILGIYMKLVHKVSIVKCNIILNINFEEEDLEKYNIIRSQISLYKKYKSLRNNSMMIITKIYHYNRNDLDNKLFDNHMTDLYLDEILALKLKEMSQTISSRSSWYKNINEILFKHNFIHSFKDLYNLYRINMSNLKYIFHFKLMKSITPNDTFYYTFLKLYLLRFNSVNHPSYIISECNIDFYSINNEKIQSLFNEMYITFIEKLESIKTDSLNEQLIMHNISQTYKEFSDFYITLFPYDSLDVIEKLFKIVILLKTKKYKKKDIFISSILSHIKIILQVSKYNGLEIDKRFDKYSKKNIIIEEQMNKMYEIISQNPSKKTFLIKHYNNIKLFIEKSLKFIFPSETESNNQNNILNPVETYLIFSLLIDYIKISIDKKDELYRKVIQIILHHLTLHKVPVYIRILWIYQLYLLIQEEFNYYNEYEWQIFKSDEEYLETWNKLKYEKVGKLFMFSFPLERIRKYTFKFDEYLNNNLKYDFDIEKLLNSMCEIDEFEEDQKLMKNEIKKFASLDDVVSKLVINRFNEKKGLDFRKARMFYYMLKLKYIDYDLDFVKNLNFSTENLKNKKIKENSIIYEFLLGKYEYMFENNLFKEKDRNDLWIIMDKFTRRADKVVDERIYAFFNYIFNNYALKDLEFIFDYDFYKYPLDFVADMYFLYHQDLPKLRNDTKMFINSKTEELFTKIFSTEENIILDLNYLVYVLKMYYTTNGILKYNYYYFKSEYTEKIYEHFLGIVEKSDTKYRRYGLFNIYIFFFEYLNTNLPLLKATIQKMALCLNEFKGPDKNDRLDKGKRILRSLQNSFNSFTGNIHFPSLCNEIVDIIIKENDINDTNKNLYLQVVNLIYKSQKHLNFHKYTSKEIFDSLFKVFSSIKNEELKKNFSPIFLSYFNDLTEEENKQFIEKYEKYIFENSKEVNEDINKYNYIYILMNQLLRFKIRIPQYMQEFIIRLKTINKKENNKVKKIIIDALKRAMNYYQGSYIYMKENISVECKEVLEEMTRQKDYIV